MRGCACLVVILSLSLSCSKGKSREEIILRLENRRAPCDSLVTFLSDPQPSVRARAVNALGKLQEHSCVTSVLQMLKDANSNVRVEAALALGQIGDPSAEKPLTEKLYEDEPGVQAQIIYALGKIGTEATFLALIKFFNSEHKALREATALATARLATRGITNKTMTKAMTLLLKDHEAEVRWKASYALMRIGSNLDLSELRAATEDRDSRVRMHAITALGSSQDVTSLERLGSLLRTDKHWGVRVKVANALGNFSLSKAANYLTLLNQTNHHVRLAIIQAIGQSALGAESFRRNSREHNLTKYELEQVLIPHRSDNDESDSDLMGDEKLARPDWSDVEIGFALISYAQLLRANAVNLITEYLDHPNDRIRARAMQALGETSSTTVLPTMQRKYASSPTIVKIAILNAFAKIGYFRNPKLLIDALQEEDQVLVALAARGLAQDSVNSRKYTDRIIQAYQSLPKPLVAEVAQMIFRALGKIGDAKAIPLLVAATRTPDKALAQVAVKALERLDYQHDLSGGSITTLLMKDFSYYDIAGLGEAKALIKTNRGNIEFDLFAEEAPLTVWNFIKLAEKGFYDRLTFHRVVPNFVIQGGDPRGDSWGSPGYSIRSEFDKRPYIRGTVGMASAGKDTEGCQFFITHSAQPHLNGRYTVFGQVSSGMDVVDAIREGDVMELVSVRR
ncbi:HEAT repeat domain-containing protein [bacterium]|nr:HEAT repeat domain-containing protein [bacterium]